MGDTLRFARRLTLAETEPRGELSSTSYMLAKPDAGCPVLQPSEAGERFSVSWFREPVRPSGSA